MSGLIIDSSGNLYGTTSNGGTFGFGTAFELINASGNYTETVLHHFGGTPADGVMPVASLLMDGAGNLFGTTKMGGSATACGGLGCGTVFELVNSSGNYTEKLLHSFGGAGDRENAAAPLIMDSAGNLYSTTEVGGSNLSLGTVFEINPTADAPAVMLSTSALTFDQIAGTSSPPQAITVTNTGLANLIFGSNGVTLSGANIAGFSISADTCSNQIILPAATCSVSVTFSPTVFGTESGALTFSDNAVNSSQTVSLIGTALENSLTTVTSSNSSITVGTNVTFFARVAPTTGGPTPTGTVQFTANGSAIGSAGLSSGSAQISTSALAAGSISIVAAYGGDSIYAASNGLFTETVIGPPSYTVTANPAALTIVAPGQSVSTILTFTSQNGLTGAGTLSSPTCGISASEKISCSLAAFTLPANGTATSVLTFMSTAASMTTPSVLGGPQTGPPTASCRIIQIQVLVYLLFFSVIAFAFHSKDRRLNVLFAAVLIAVAITSVNCGGSGGGGGGNPGTPIGPVQGLSVSISINGTTRTVPNLTLTVQ